MNKESYSITHVIVSLSLTETEMVAQCLVKKNVGIYVSKIIR